MNREKCDRRLHFIGDKILTNDMEFSNILHLSIALSIICSPFSLLLQINTLRKWVYGEFALERIFKHLGRKLKAFENHI